MEDFHGRALHLAADDFRGPEIALGKHALKTTQFAVVPTSGQPSEVRRVATTAIRPVKRGLQSVGTVAVQLFILFRGREIPAFRADTTDMTVSVHRAVTQRGSVAIEFAEGGHIRVHVRMLRSFVLIHTRDRICTITSGHAHIGVTIAVGLEVALCPAIAIDTHTMIDITFAVNSVGACRENHFHKLCAGKFDAALVRHRPGNHMISFSVKIVGRHVVAHRGPVPTERVGRSAEFGRIDRHHAVAEGQQFVKGGRTGNFRVRGRHVNHLLGGLTAFIRHGHRHVNGSAAGNWSAGGNRL